MLERVAKKSFFHPGPTARPRLFALGLLVVVLSSPALTVSAHADSQRPAALEHYVHRLVNDHRVALGLTPLALSPEISEIARHHSRDMATRRVRFGHGGMALRREKIANFIFSKGEGENVAAIGPRPRVAPVVVFNWLQSPGHRRNMEGSYHLTGIGVTRAADGMYYFTQLFVVRPKWALDLERLAAFLGLGNLWNPPASAGLRPAPLPVATALPVRAARRPSSAARAPRRGRPEKDPRVRRLRRRTDGGWVQRLE